MRGEGGQTEKRKAYTIAFQPTQRPGVYSSAMRANVFGERVPMDPFKGDPFVWARLSGKTLSVYALIILADGGYDLQIYDRTLTPDGPRPGLLALGRPAAGRRAHGAPRAQGRLNVAA